MSFLQNREVCFDQKIAFTNTLLQFPSQKSDQTQK